MHSFLQMQGLNYTILVAEQESGSPFNRAKLLNIGFVESVKLFSSADCFIFHDVDLLPTSSDNHYHCFSMPRHMISSLNEFRYNLPYNQMVGGGLAISKSQFIQVNGFSNQFYGWGGEDDDFYQRLADQHLYPLRFPAHQAHYVSLKHHKQSPSSKTAAHSASLSEDGLSTLHYQRKDIRILPMCTIVTVTV